MHEVVELVEGVDRIWENVKGVIGLWVLATGLFVGGGTVPVDTRNIMVCGDKAFL